MRGQTPLGMPGQRLGVVGGDDFRAGPRPLGADRISQGGGVQSPGYAVNRGTEAPRIIRGEDPRSRQPEGPRIIASDARGPGPIQLQARQETRQEPVQRLQRQGSRQEPDPRLQTRQEPRQEPDPRLQTRQEPRQEPDPRLQMRQETRQEPDPRLQMRQETRQEPDPRAGARPLQAPDLPREAVAPARPPRGYTADLADIGDQRGSANKREDASPTKGSLKEWFQDPEKLNYFVRNNFREYCKTRHGGSPFLVFEDMEHLSRSLAAKLRVNPKIFGEINQMFWRFDFQGEGKLDEESGTQLLLFMLRQYRDHTSPPEPGQVRLGGKIEYKNLKAHFEVTRKLGEGGQGTALLAKNKATGENICVKLYDKSNPSAPLEDITQEFELLIGLKHPRIAHVFEIFQDASNIYVVQEAYYGGDLCTAIQKAHENKVKVNEPWLAKVMYQCVVGVNFLHGKHIMHCDLKEPNVMLASNTDFANPQVVVIDFGLANQFHSKSQPGGTPGYMPPEVWPPQGLWTPKGDVFSIGVMLFSLRTGVNPFSQNCRSIEEVMARTQRSSVPEMNGIQENIRVSNSMNQLVTGMLCKDFLQRPSMREVMDHPWFNDNTEQPNFHASILLSLAKRDTKQDIHRALLADLAANQNLAQMKELNDLFMGIDSDGDGVITADEVRKCLGPKWKTSDIDKLINVLIGDKGEVAYDEFMGQMIALRAPQERELLQDIFDDVDTDKNGYITRPELQALLDRPAIYKVLGDKRDTVLDQLDKDGHMSFDDFCFAIYGKRGMDGTSGAAYSLGQQVEYYSSSFSIWMPCEVTRVDESSGAIQISAKPDFWMSVVEARKRVRPLQSGTSSGATGASGQGDETRRSMMDKAKLAGIGRQLFSSGMDTEKSKNSTDYIQEGKGFFKDLKAEAKGQIKDVKALLGFGRSKK